MIKLTDPLIKFNRTTAACLAVFVCGMLLSLALRMAGEEYLASRALVHLTGFSVNAGGRQPSFATTGQGNALAGFADVNPFRADVPAPEQKADTAAVEITSLALAGTLPGIGAWIRDDAGTHLLLRGQEIAGFKLENVSYGRALFSKGGTSYPLYLTLSGGSVAGAMASTSGPAQNGKKSGIDFSGIVPAKGDAEGSVPAEVMNKLIMDPYDEMSKIRMVPSGGGMQIQRIAPDSVLQHVGVLQNDIINSLNGIQVSTLADVANAMNSVVTGSRLDVGVTRGGKQINLKYAVK